MNNRKIYANIGVLGCAILTTTIAGAVAFCVTMFLLAFAQWSLDFGEKELMFARFVAAIFVVLVLGANIVLWPAMYSETLEEMKHRDWLKEREKKGEEQ